MTTFLLAFGALFSIVNPLSGAFIFFGATRELEPRVRESFRCSPRAASASGRRVGIQPY